MTPQRPGLGRLQQQPLVREPGHKLPPGPGPEQEQERALARVQLLGLGPEQERARPFDQLNLQSRRCHTQRIEVSSEVFR